MSNRSPVVKKDILRFYPFHVASHNVTLRQDCINGIVVDANINIAESDFQYSDIHQPFDNNILNCPLDKMLMNNGAVFQMEQGSLSVPSSELNESKSARYDTYKEFCFDKRNSRQIMKKEEYTKNAYFWHSNLTTGIFVLLTLFIMGVSIEYTLEVIRFLRRNSDSDLSVPTATYESVLVFGMLSLNRYSNFIDIAKVFQGSQRRGCINTIRNDRDCPVTPNIRSVKDPNGSQEKVLQVTFKNDTYGVKNGAQFYTDLNDSTSDEVVLTYHVRFSKDFQFQKGGKLPGLHGGSMTCSGGRKATGSNCWSARLMWREEGTIETYFYTPLSEAKESFCRQCGRNLGKHYVLYQRCSEIYSSYCSFAKSSTVTYKIIPDRWIHVEQYVKLNSVGEANGIYQLKINGVEEVYFEEVVYRTSAKLGIGGLFFSTFFGGSTRAWASPKSQQIYYKEIKIYEKRWILDEVTD